MHACVGGSRVHQLRSMHACVGGSCVHQLRSMHACVGGSRVHHLRSMHACVGGSCVHQLRSMHACVGGWVSCTSPQIMCTCSPTGQMYALRLYLDMMVHELYGFNQTGEFFARLLHLRFRGLEDLFPPHPNDPMLCSRRTEGKIPTAIHVHGYVKLDMQLMSSHFRKLLPEAMDILFMDYVEEISAQV